MKLLLVVALAACIVGASACGKHAYDDAGVGSWSGGCTGAKVTAVDGTAARDQFNIISKVRLYYSEDLGCVKGVQARHGWANPANLVTVGSTAYPEVAKLSLTQGEYITSVSWAAKAGCISYLSLKTNKGNEAAAGVASADAATFTAKDGHYLAAFKGASSTDKSCSALAALSFRWGYDDCETAAVEEPAAPTPAPAPACAPLLTCNGYGNMNCAVASCVDGQVVLGLGAVNKPTGLKCAEVECAAEPAPAPPSVVTFSGVIGKKHPFLGGNRRLSGFGLAKLAAIKGMATGAATQAVGAVNSAVSAGSAAVQSAVQTKVSAVQSRVAAMQAAAAAPEKCFNICQKEGINLLALKASLKGL